MHTTHTRYSSPEARLERLKKFGNVLMTATVAAGLGAAVGTVWPVKKVSAEQSSQEIIAKQLSNFAISNRADDATLRAEIERSLLISASAAIYANTSETIIDGYVDEIVEALFIQLREAGTPVGVNNMSAVVAIDGHDIAFNLEIFVYDDTQAFLEDNNFVLFDQAPTQENLDADRSSLPTAVTYKVQTGEVLSISEQTLSGEQQLEPLLAQVSEAPTIVAADPDGNDRINATGTSALDTTVTVTWPDGTKTFNVPVNTEGIWTVESPTSQSSGTLSVTAIDLAGNASVTVSTQYADITPPSKPSIYISDADNDRLPTASGSMSGVFQAGTTITITWPDGTMTDGVPLDAAGHWTVESNAQQSSGNITAQAVDPAGNTSPIAVAPWEADVYAGIDFDANPINASNSIYKGQLFDVYGTVTDVEDGQTVKLTVTDGLTSKYFTTVVENGKWKVLGISSSDFKLGALGLSAWTIDLAGNETSNVRVTAVLDFPSIDILDAQTVVEGETSQFIISLETALEYDTEITYQTQSGTASEGSDFIAKTGVVVLKAGQTSVIVDVATLDDSFDEADEEKYSLQLLSAKVHIGNQLLALPLVKTQAQAGIKDNDRSGFVIDTRATVHINPVSTIYESQVLNITGYVEDIEEGQEVTVTLVSALGDEKTYVVNVVNGQWSLTNIDYSLFLEGNSVSLTATATAVDQAGNTASDGEVFAILPLPTVRVTDNPTIKEGEQAEFIFSLDQEQPYDVYLTFTSLGGSAGAGDDFEDLTGGIWIRAGQKQVTVFVNTTQDSIVEPDENFTVIILTAHLDLDGDALISETDLPIRILPPANEIILDDDVLEDKEHSNSVTIESIATDNHLTLLEQAQEKITVTGHAMLPTDTAEYSLLLKVYDQTYSAIVALDGSWSLEVSTADLLQDEDLIIEAILTSKDSANNSAMSSDSLSYTVDHDTEALEGATLEILHVAHDDYVSLTEQAQATAVIGGRFSLPIDVKEASLAVLVGNMTYFVELHEDGSWQVDVRMEDLLTDSDQRVIAVLSVIDQAGNSDTITQLRAYSIDEEQLIPEEKTQVGLEEESPLPPPQLIAVPQESGEDFVLEVISEKVSVAEKAKELPKTGETLDLTLTASGILLLALVGLMKKKQSLESDKHKV
ncbi:MULTISPECIES: Calx-beta domain-containing protein [Lactococcus]|uniref:Calx-beta domain-containing protein n=1 Tax=Lactococcus TaxID=1357 RepID=UPI00230171B4|nr:MULTISPECIES: Calx-beta domain-containing protein [unclassified Lactococcus]